MMEQGQITKKPPKNVRSAAMSDAERQKSREASQRAFDFC